jgi:hypothetical protein
VFTFLITSWDEWNAMGVVEKWKFGKTKEPSFFILSRSLSEQRTRRSELSMKLLLLVDCLASVQPLLTLVRSLKLSVMFLAFHPFIFRNLNSIISFPLMHESSWTIMMEFKS